MNNVIVKCIFDKDWIKRGEDCLFIGEINNMPGHGIYVHKGVTFYGYHIEDFQVVTPKDA